MKDENQTDYDFTQGVRGKYYTKYLKGTNTVVLKPEVAKMFPDSASVNEALKTLIRAAGQNKALQRPRKTRRRA